MRLRSNASRTDLHRPLGTWVPWMARRCLPMANAWAAPVPGKTQNPTSGGEALSDPPTNSEKALLEKGSGPPNFLQDCFEKIELVDRVKDAMAKGITEGSASPSPATSATSATGSSPRTPPQDSLGLGIWERTIPWMVSCFWEESTRRFLHFGELVEIPSLRAEEGVLEQWCVSLHVDAFHLTAGRYIGCQKHVPI